MQFKEICVDRRCVTVGNALVLHSLNQFADKALTAEAKKILEAVARHVAKLSASRSRLSRMDQLFLQLKELELFPDQRDIVTLLQNIPSQLHCLYLRFAP